MRDRTVWGEDADEFVPERWLDERARASEKNNFSWGYGPRMCLGKPVAELELLLATKAVS